MVIGCLIDSLKSNPAACDFQNRGSKRAGTLADAGPIYRNRHGKHLLAVPLLGQFIQPHPQRSLSTFMPWLR